MLHIQRHREWVSPEGASDSVGESSVRNDLLFSSRDDSNTVRRLSVTRTRNMEFLRKISLCTLDRSPSGLITVLLVGSILPGEWYQTRMREDRQQEAYQMPAVFYDRICAKYDLHPLTVDGLNFVDLY